MKQKVNKYEVVFLISLIPYILLVFKLLGVAIFGYGYNLGDTAYGIVAIGEWFNYFFSEYWVVFKIKPLHILFICCLIYQIIYFIKLRHISNKKHESKDQIKKYDKTKIIFILSFIPYIVLILFTIYSAIFGFRYSFFTTSTVVYGIEAIKAIMLFYGVGFCIIPVFPTCIVYQIIYLVLNKKRKKNVEKLNI